MINLLMILGILLLFIGFSASIVTTIVFIVKKKKVKIPAICIPTTVILSFACLAVGASLYSETDEYKQSMSEKQLKLEGQQKKTEFQNNETLENESTFTEVLVPEETNNEETELGSTIVEQISIESTEEKITEESIENQIEKDEISNKVQIVIESIGMNYSQTKSWKKLDNWSSGKRYGFVYNGFDYIVYELGNGEIDSINTEYKRIKIYERGYKPLNYKDFEPDISIIDTLQPDMIQRLSSYIIGETSIKSKIGSIMYSRIYDYYSISGEVKAKNAVSKKDFTFTVDYIVLES